MTQRATWRALGADVTLVVETARLSKARAAVADLLDLVDRTYSRFRPDSELSRLNASPGQRVPLSPLFAWALEAALRGARLTDGLVDPTIGRTMRLIGYDVDFSRMRDLSHWADASPVRLEPVPGWQAVELNMPERLARIPPGVELDLGSTGKALASDLAASAALAAMGGGGTLVSLGGDIAVAGDPPSGGWRVLAAENSSVPPDADGEVITLRSGAIATSSTTVRRWTRAGIRLHHLIDPRSGKPATGPWRTASVVAANCVDANVAATASIILGSDAPAWLAERHLAARLVGVDGSVHRLAGWPAPIQAAVAS